jgi:hypothetical protein
VSSGQEESSADRGGLLWTFRSVAKHGDYILNLVLLSLLMRVRKAPTEREIQTRARAAMETLFSRFP